MIYSSQELLHVQENGKVCIIENFPNQGLASSELTVLRPSNKVLPRYLLYFVQTHRIRQFAISQMLGTTGRQRVPDYVFKKYLRFELPPLDEQARIIDILSKIYSLIKKIDQIIEQTQRLKKGLMQRLLTKGIGHTKFKTTPIGEIPENWDVSTIGNECKVGSGGTPSRRQRDYFKGNIPWVKTTELNYNLIMKTEESIIQKALDDSSAKVYPIGTFLIAMIG